MLIEHFSCIKVPVGTTEQIHYTEVPVGTTGLILIFIDTGVSVGTTEIYQIQEYL